MNVNSGTTDQSIRFFAYDEDGAAVTGEAYNSAGMTVSVVVRRKGRIVSTTALTLVARSGVGVHTDSALTEVANGEYVVDLADSYFATAGDHVSLSVASTAITGTVVVESLVVVDVTLFNNLTAMITGSGASAAWSETAVGNVPSPLQGDWAITRTFQISGGTKVPNVQMSLVGVAGKVDTTGSDGVAQINTDDGTYTLRVSVPFGYEAIADSSITINGADSTAIVTLVATTVDAPTNPAKSALQVLCVDEDGEPEAGVAVDIRIVKVPSGSVNIAFKGTKQTATSGVDGVAEFEAYKGGTYQYKRGTADEWESVVIGNGDTTNVNSFIGAP